MKPAPPRAEAIDRARDDWDTHWGDYASTAEDNPAQAYRRRRAFALLEECAPVLRLLDIGAGQGDLLRFAAAAFPKAELAGVELSATGVEVARAKVPQAQLMQRNLLLDEPVADQWRGWATHAVCSEVLEHVDDPALLLRNASVYLAAGCQLVVTVPGGPRSAFDKHIGHRRHFTKARLIEVLEDAGFVSPVVQRAGFPAFNLYKLAVIARGERLVADVRASEAASTDHPVAITARTANASRAMRAFRPLFQFLALPASPFGWQLVGQAIRG